MDKAAAKTYLESLAFVPDAQIDLAEAALALSALHGMHKNMDPARRFLQRLDQEMQAHKGTDTAEQQIDILQKLLYETHGFMGDDTSFDDLQNADLPAVITRRKGIPITLAIIALFAAKCAGFAVSGINFPGHFLLRFEAGAARILCDPFDGLKQVGAPQLRSILKRTQGADAELSSSFFDPTSNREILLRLENNIKCRQIDAEDYAAALDTVRIMRLFAPNDSRLWFDEGLLLARLEEPAGAIKALEMYRDTSPSQADKEQAAQLIQALRLFIN